MNRDDENDDPIEDLISGRSGSPLLTEIARMARSHRAGREQVEEGLLELGFDDDLVDDERSDEISVAAFGRDAGFPRVYASAALRVALDRTDGGILALQLGGEPHWSLILEEGWVSMVPDVWTEAPPMPRAPAQLRARDALGREVVLVPTE
jgi:hypothetical protein